jgi:hypothetical protein
MIVNQRNSSNLDVFVTFLEEVSYPGCNGQDRPLAKAKKNTFTWHGKV